MIWEQQRLDALLPYPVFHRLPCSRIVLSLRPMSLRERFPASVISRREAKLFQSLLLFCCARRIFPSGIDDRGNNYKSHVHTVFHAVNHSLGTPFFSITALFPSTLYLNHKDGSVKRVVAIWEPVPGNDPTLACCSGQRICGMPHGEAIASAP